MKIVRTIMKWLGIGIGALLVLIILASLIMNVIFGRELRQTMAQLKAEGRALTIAEIRPAPIPDDQNAAPLFQKAAELMGSGTYNKPAPKAAPSIKELSDLISSNNTLDISTWPTAHREALPRLIQAPEMIELFAVLREAAQKPGYNNNLKYEDGPSMLLPNLGSIRQIARVLSIKAELDVQAGNGAEAFATVLEGLKLADLLKQEPVLVTQLVRIACDLVMIDRMERMADETDIPPDQARALIVELAQHTDATPWVRTMDGERVAMGLWCFQTFQHGSFHDFNSLLDMGMDMHFAPWLGWGLQYLYMPILKKDFAVYLTLMSQVQDYYKVPYWKAAETIRNHPTDQQIPRYCLLTRLLFPNLTAVVTRNTEHDAAIDVARVGLGLKLFKQKNGAYPDLLDKLTPEFLESIPVDPFTGKALIYRKADAGFMLYSLGPNQQDDNGTPRPTGKQATGEEPYDIAWKCAR
ncbi:MAG: hypothetical protein KJ964_02875 [Verrucomicrobia bacterium]|nr:hypothetical protein [Verrucomicrobiota bacterium]MBU1734153.1 hypothetical protein [Verrucomicrobiota bacterium]MBU1856489.1 hypothetical protein [Verrucomicrobiota bacterium]